MWFFFAFMVLAVTGLVAVAWSAATLKRRRTAFLARYDFPAGLRSRVRARYPHLTDADLDRVFDGLRAWFHLARSAGLRTLAMPSQVVDVAWHEFILFTRNYAHFCRQSLGRFLHHTPAEAMRTPTEAQQGIRRAWRLACAREGIDPRQPDRLPALFALDAELRIPDGFRYALNCAALLGAAHAGSGPTYCGSHIGCGSGGGDGGCSSDSGCSGGGDGGGCGGGGGD
jgi:hypothetical protein